MVLASIQPLYLPWIPYFQRMHLSDIFIYLDDVEYSKNSFHNRNKIKIHKGTLMLTVPVFYKGHSKAFICDIKIDYTQSWQRKHWKSIEQSYRKAMHFDDIGPVIRKLLFTEFNSLADLNISLIEFLKEYIGITTLCYRSSELGIGGRGNEKLVNICKKLKINKFVVKPNTERYHPKTFFEKNEIKFRYFMPKPVKYKQLYGDFIDNLSILDYAMNCGPNSFKESSRNHRGSEQILCVG